tara:strand:- start:267 stop:389 length:123 start_codon:yes stop_codon:yes gene_type:complete
MVEKVMFLMLEVVEVVALELLVHQVVLVVHPHQEQVVEMV